MTVKSNQISVIIPAAGLGTRLLPATKAIPKELLPVVDTPAIQYIVEELTESGVQNIVFITAKGKDAVLNHFDSSPDLENRLASGNKTVMLDKVRKPVRMAAYSAVRQPKPLGLGHAVLMAKPVVSGKMFGIVLPDDLIDSEEPVFKQLLNVYERFKPDGVIALMEVEDSEVSKYGVVSGALLDEGTFEITGMVEKPAPKEAPSRYAIIGRYFLNSRIFQILEELPPGKGGEIQLTDAIEKLISDGGKVLGCIFKGERFDTGDVSGYLSANLNYALKRPELFETIMKNIETLTEKYRNFH